MAARLSTSKNANAPAPSGSTIKSKKKQRFVFFRSLTLADFITLVNAAAGTCSIFFCLNFLENAKYEPYLQGAFFLLPIALVADIADGSVARWRKSSSPYGADLDSLADVVSFIVAPAVLGFTLGLRGIYDCFALSFFVCCGIGRLARFNVTCDVLSAGSGKVKFYQGFPVPTSLAIVVMLGILYRNDLVFGNIPFGTFVLRGGTLHPISLIYGFWGTMMISEFKLPKP